jgi:hypothetical protein
MALNEPLTLTQLNKLGITPDTNPNDPSTWSDTLKARHGAVLTNLPEDRRSKIKVAVSGSPISDSTEPTAEPITTGWLTRAQEASEQQVNNIDTSGDGPDGRPKEIDEANWGSLNDTQKSAIKKYVQEHREHVARWSRPNVPYVPSFSSSSSGWGGSTQWADSARVDADDVARTFGYKSTWDLKKVKKKDRLSDEDQTAANHEALRKTYSLLKDYPIGFYTHQLREAGVDLSGDSNESETTQPDTVNPASSSVAEAQSEEEPMPQPQSDMFGKMLQAAEDYPAPTSQLDGSSNVGQQFKDLESEEDPTDGKPEWPAEHTGPIIEPTEPSYANPWPKVRCAFCGDEMPGQHYAANHGSSSESPVCTKARNADPRSDWAKSIGITPKFRSFDRSTWSKEVKDRSNNYQAANGPVHPDTGEAVHTGPTELTPRNPEYRDGEQEPTREDVLKHWSDFRPSDLDYYMEKHGISEDELKPRAEVRAQEEASGPSPKVSSGPFETDVDAIKSRFKISTNLFGHKVATYTSPTANGLTDLRLKFNIHPNYEVDKKYQKKYGKYFADRMDENGQPKPGFGYTVDHTMPEPKLPNGRTISYDTVHVGDEYSFDTALNMVASHISRFHKYANELSDPNYVYPSKREKTASPVEEQPAKPAGKPLTCTFCGETSPDEESFKRDHQIYSNGWCKTVVDAHNSLNPQFPINVQ